MNPNTLKKTTLTDGKIVSTVKLTIDHGFWGAPLWYETMVFPNAEDFTDMDCERYATAAEAAAGHETVVAKWGVPADE